MANVKRVNLSTVNLQWSIRPMVHDIHMSTCHASWLHHMSELPIAPQLSHIVAAVAAEQVDSVIHQRSGNCKLWLGWIDIAYRLYHFSCLYMIIFSQLYYIQMSSCLMSMYYVLKATHFVSSGAVRLDLASDTYHYQRRNGIVHSAFWSFFSFFKQLPQTE